MDEGSQTRADLATGADGAAAATADAAVKVVDDEVKAAGGEAKAADVAHVKEEGRA